MKQDLNKQLPISIKHIDHILEKIYNQYPYISKVDIALIVKTFFETIRYIIVSGNSLSINSFISKIKLISFIRNGRKVIKTKISTPWKIKNV